MVSSVSYETDLKIRSMCEADLGSVYALQVRVYPAAYHEPVAVFAGRLERGAAFSLVAERQGDICAYLLAYPWQGNPPPLHEKHPVFQEWRGADHIFLHDLAVDSALRGRALGNRLHQTLVSRCLQQNFMQIRLVAVEGASLFWKRLGFEYRHGVQLHPSYGKGTEMVQLLPLPQDFTSG